MPLSYQRPTSARTVTDLFGIVCTSVDYLPAGNPVDNSKLATRGLYRRFQALSGLAEGDRDSIVEVIDAMVVKHRTTKVMEVVGSWSDQKPREFVEQKLGLPPMKNVLICPRPWVFPVCLCQTSANLL